MMTLDEYLRASGETNAAFGGRLGISAVSVSRLRNGHQWPKRELAHRIKEATDGKVTDWLSPKPEAAAR